MRRLTKSAIISLFQIELLFFWLESSPMVKSLISAENFWKIIISSLKKWRWKIFHFKKKTFLSAKNYMWWILSPRAVWIYRFPHDPHNSSPNMTRNVQLIEHLTLFWKCQNPGVVIDSCCFYDKKAAIKEIPIYYDKGMSGISILANVTQAFRSVTLSDKGTFTVTWQG